MPDSGKSRNLLKLVEHRMCCPNACCPAFRRNPAYLFHYHPIEPSIASPQRVREQQAVVFDRNERSEWQTPPFANVLSMPSRTSIPEFTTRYARGTEIRRRGPRNSEIGITLACSTLTSFDCQSQICANSPLREEEEGDSICACKLLSSSLHLWRKFERDSFPGAAWKAIGQRPRWQRSGNLLKFTPSPPSLCASAVRSPLLYGTLATLF